MTRWRTHISLALLSTTFLLLLITFLPPSGALAASASSSSLRISPAISNIQLSAHQTSAPLTVTVTNQTASLLNIALSARDFGALNGSGTVSFYGKGYNPATNPHSLQQAVSFATPSIELGPQATQKVIITLANVDKLAAGGHYGAILFSPIAPVSTGAKSSVSIRTSVASLVFLITANGGTQQLKLLPFTLKFLRLSLPENNYLAFSNKGNTQAVPYGQLTLFGPNSHIVSTTTVNSGSGMILPGDSRLFTETLPLAGKRFARPGMYRLQLRYRNGTSSQLTTVSRSFFYVNLSVFVPVVVLLIVIIYIARRYGKDVLRRSKRVGRRMSRLLCRKKQKKVIVAVPTPKSKPKHKRKLVQ